ncbi:MAG: hydroxyacylglutathione hydrolase [Rickettsiales bacterium]|nr:hydroxyacylglutathione hydrolase [Rickettsiales bacterium]|tara:strand:- start:1838 stop:2611 length:774 start_codon:yes stop_codon:yes gene_type:complete
MPLEVHLIDMRHVNDNYNFVLRDQATGKVAVVDPSELEGVQAFLTDKGWSLDAILCTHHHWDHTNGNREVQKIYDCPIVGNAADAARIPGITEQVHVGGTYALGESVAEILPLDGHTMGHIAYYFADSQALFCGDALFSMGCGRLFEGTPEDLAATMQRIRALPEDTKIYCAHEYTIANGRFARAMEPENAAVTAHIERAKAQRKAGQATIPSTLAEECQSNPFLRWDSPEIQSVLAMQGANPSAILGELRARKDAF